MTLKSFNYIVQRQNVEFVCLLVVLELDSPRHHLLLHMKKFRHNILEKICSKEDRKSYKI